jgi:hypothetical protein
MAAYIVNRPTVTGIQTAIDRSNTIGSAAQTGNITPNKFVFFAVFAQQCTAGSGLPFPIIH